MSVEIKAAVFGAIFGVLANVAIEIIKYFTSRRSLKKALSMGLFFEIDHHKVINVSKDSNGQPNFFY